MRGLELEGEAKSRIQLLCVARVLLPKGIPPKKNNFPSLFFFTAGNYSCLVAEFHLHRSIGFHLIQSYLPSILIVAISWVSFWMDVDCVPARVTLGVITLLTVSSQVSGTMGGKTSCVILLLNLLCGASSFVSQRDPLQDESRELETKRSSLSVFLRTRLERKNFF